MTTAGEVVEEGGVRDGHFDMEGEGGREGEGVGGVEVGGEGVDAGFVGYFYFYWGLSSTVGAATRVVITTEFVVVAAAAAEVGHVRGLPIAALELGEQLGLPP